jgi:hypothetical protein
VRHLHHRIVAATVASLLLATVVACGGDDSATTSNTTSSTARSTSSTAASGTTTTSAGAELVLTASAYGDVQLGESFAAVQSAGLIDGAVTKGCEVDEGSQAASLTGAYASASLGGHGGKVDHINVRDRYITSPGGIRHGDPLTKLDTAFTAPDEVVVDKGSEDTFGVWFAHVGPDLDHSIFSFTVDPSTQQVLTVGIPDIAICD